LNCRRETLKYYKVIKTSRYERHIVLTKFLTQVAEDYEVKNTMYNQDSHKEGTARRFLCSILSNNVNCYTLHVSMFGYTRKGTTEVLPYTEESCNLFKLVLYKNI
jgi:hypothetical protein